MRPDFLNHPLIPKYSDQNTHFYKFPIELQCCHSSQNPPSLHFMTSVNETSVLQALHDAIATAPSSLFAEFSVLRPLLLTRSPISRNRPLFHSIADRLIAYRRTGTFPSPIPYSHIKSDNTKPLNDSFFHTHRALLDSLDLYSSAHLQYFLQVIGLTGVHLLCGLRTTTGSNKSLFPPSTEELFAAFNERHKGQPLTVGGRALSKHAVRDSSRFWGVCTGTNDFINEEAMACLVRIIEHCVWNNVFVLPHGLMAYEVRIGQGYGARWEFHQAGITFRGFVEPPMEDGHLKKWRH
jgi:hypothetical protein